MRTTGIITLLLAATVVASCSMPSPDEEPAPPPAEQRHPPATTTAPVAAAGDERQGPAGPADAQSSGGATRTGGDVFRLNCQACHGPGGAGTARAPTLMNAARALAAGGDTGPLRRRLASGGQRMPAFRHLTGPEIDALVAYLTELGGGEVAAAPTVAALTGTALGERIYESNCASCHESKVGMTSATMCRPASLAGATERFDKRQVMNLLDVGVGPMPAFAHLTAVERDALWAYLATLAGEPDAPPTMGEMCPMVSISMEGRRTGGTVGGRGTRPGMMERGVIGGGMMRGGRGCPMMRRGWSTAERDEAPAQPPPCCR